MNALDVEFVDRYTGTPHEGKPWLRGCVGDCEAMGYFPVQDPDLPRGSVWVERSEAEEAADRKLVAKARADGQEPDDLGYFFVKCPECDGTGNVSRWVAFKRLPRLFRSWWSFLIGRSGPEDMRWWTVRWTMRYFPRELVRTFTWRMPR